MTVRVEGGVAYTQTWDVDNRLFDVGGDFYFPNPAS